MGDAHKGDAGAVIDSVLRRITPTESERKEIDVMLYRIMKATEDAVRPLKLEKTLAGSFLRDTWLADKKELDIFILFPAHVPREELESTGLSIGKSITKSLGGAYEIAYAEHPYVRARFGDFLVDFVPCYDIRDPGMIQSSVDRTPHHNRYILKSLVKGMSSQVRLLKQFCKGIGVYGSDLRVEGFSGYLCELLIIRYGTFRNLLAEAAKWEAGKVFIDLEGHASKGSPGASARFSSQPLVVIDPVDKNRNVAAALSPAAFERFRHSCASFLESPSERYFRISRAPMDRKRLRSLAEARGTLLLLVAFKRPAVVDDVLYPQMRKSVRRLGSALRGGDFRVLGQDAWCDPKGCALLLELEVWKLPNIRVIIGPPVFSGGHSRQFIGKYKGKGRLLVEGSDWIAETSRDFTEAPRALRAFLKGGRAALEGRGIASYVARGLSSGFAVKEGAAVLGHAAGNMEFAMFLTNYFKNKIV